jgi:hypothetical protein
LVNAVETFERTQNLKTWLCKYDGIFCDFSTLRILLAMRSVRTLYTALMVHVAKATDRELARMVSYLHEENRVLRARLTKRIQVTPKERQLLRFGRKLGTAAVDSVVGIVSPGTFLRWLREEKRAGKRVRKEMVQVPSPLPVSLGVDAGVALFWRHAVSGG